MSQAVWSRAVLPERLRRELAEACLRRWPKEACGVLLGDFRGDTVYVDAFRIIRNVAPRPENAFMFDPAEWVRIFFDAQNRGETIVGIFHSHPDGRLEPSDADAKAQLPWGTYWIAGISHDACQIAAYQPLEGGAWRPVPVEASDDEV